MKNTTPRTDMNEDAMRHVTDYGFENSLHDPVIPWPEFARQLERQLAAERAAAGVLREALKGLLRVSDVCVSQRSHDIHCEEFCDARAALSATANRGETK